ncbi:MAG: IS481 family transposase, partial [Acidobacteriota bacterium]|nr:IS481 family transposase [Acidobacteriota bacterium]
SSHRNAKLGLAGRHALVAAIAAGMTLRQAAAVFNVSPATAHRWWSRWREASSEARVSWACLHDRSSRPHRSPRLLAGELAERICACRRETGWSPRLIGSQIGFAHSTVSKVLTRAGLSRPAKPVREPANRYEWPCPGDLLHMDVSEYARFSRPGHRVTGDRSSQDRTRRAGIDYVHAIIDDHTRLAYAEIHPDQRAATCAGFLERALAFYADHGITPRRLMTDNAWSYVKSRALRQLLARHQLRHLTTKPYRPRTNGKVERFHQTMGREWAYGLVYQSDHDRTAALPHWLHHYNTTRPHSALAGQPPISRVHNLRRQDI